MTPPPLKNLKLFSAFHKPFIIPQASYVQPVHAGKALSKADLGLIGDDTGDNISHLNPFFSELTVIYWIWKNIPRTEVNYWGIVHYRRYFYLGKGWKPKRFYDFTNTQEEMDKINTPELYQSLIKSVQKRGLAVTKKTRILKVNGRFLSIEEHYKQSHIEAHWDIMLDVIREKYPAYVRSFVFFKKDEMSLFNMMIASWQIWDHYLTWLFDILFEVQARIGNIDDPYQTRVYGFLSERLLNLFIYHNKYQPKYYSTALVQ